MFTTLAPVPVVMAEAVTNTGNASESEPFAAMLVVLVHSTSCPANVQLQLPTTSGLVQFGVMPAGIASFTVIVPMVATVALALFTVN